MKTLKIIVLSCLSLLLLSCGQSTIDPTSLSVYALNGPTAMGMIQMFEDHTQIEDTISVTYTNVSQPDLIVGKLLKEEVDIAAIPTNLASTIYHKTNGAYKVVAVNTQGVLYVVTQEDSDIKTFSDLKGKTIGASGLGSTAEYVLNHLLALNQMVPQEDVTIDYSLSHADLAASVMAGTTEIAILPQPFVTTVTMKSDAKIAISFQEEWSKFESSDLAMGCLVVKSSLLDSKADVVDLFLKHYAASVAWVNANPQEAGLLIEKFGVLPQAKMAELAIPQSNIVFMIDGDMVTQMKGILTVLEASNPQAIGGQLPDENFYYKK